MTNGNQKGKRGEREAAALLKSFGFEARRGKQYSGGDDSPDVVHSIPGVHIEVKRTETLSLYTAFAQAVADAGKKTPIILHRRNGKPWLAVIAATDLLALIREYHRQGEALRGVYKLPKPEKE